MTFAKDRDLLIVEPLLARDVAWSAQRLIEATGASISGTTLTAASVNFTLAGVDTGHIAMIGAVTVEVIERLSATQLTVSLLRASTGDPPLPPPPGTGLTLIVPTFLPQIALVHAQLLRAVGVEPGDSERRPNASDITNPAALAPIEALAALHTIYTAAAAMAGAHSLLWEKAKLHLDRFHTARARGGVELDLDGDGAPDALRRFNTLQLARG